MPVCGFRASGRRRRPRPASADGSLGTENVLLATLTRRLSVGAGAAKSSGAKFVLSAGLAAGTYRLIADVDWQGAPADANGDDDVAVGAGVFVVG